MQQSVRSADREFAQAYLETGLLETEDYLYYVPWMQATYIMAAHKDALEFLPAGADINALTWEQFAEWCQTLLDETGGPKCGVPHAGLFNRFLQGFLWPSYTGGMVTKFKSQEAADMLEWARDSLWPTIHPQSISYEFMQEPLLSGEVWVAFDHVARLIEAFNEQPENFVAFPAPAGPAGRGYMPVVVGLGIPNDAPNPEAANFLPSQFRSRGYWLSWLISSCSHDINPFFSFIYCRLIVYKRDKKGEFLSILTK